MNIRRFQAAFKIRFNAARIALIRKHLQHISNGEEFRYKDDNGQPTHIANFTKGLPHNPHTGIISENQITSILSRGLILEMFEILKIRR